MSYQIIVIEGNLPADAEVRSFQSGDAIATFRVLVNEEFVNKEGDKIKLVESFRCVLRGTKWVQSLEPYLKKGKNILVQAKKKTREYKVQNETRYVEEFIVQDLKLLGVRQREQNDYGASSDEGNAPPVATHAPGVPVDPERIPF